MVELRRIKMNEEEYNEWVKSATKDDLKKVYMDCEKEVLANLCAELFTSMFLSLSSISLFLIVSNV